MFTAASRTSEFSEQNNASAPSGQDISITRFVSSVRSEAYSGLISRQAVLTATLLFLLYKFKLNELIAKE